MSYLVVDEIIDGRALLQVSPWPVVDGRGRLRFPGLDNSYVVGTDAARFVDGVIRQPDEPSRPLRIGDVFAASVRRPPRVDERTDLADHMTSPAVDISGVAREAAKSQYYAAVAGVYDERDFADLYRDRLTDDDEPDEAERHD